MKSMTGFGRSSNVRQASRKAAKASAKASRKRRSAPVAVEPEINVAVKAVNGRFLDVRIHLPREYASFESEIRAQLTKIFARGTVDVYINRSNALAPASVAVNEVLAKAWVQSFRELARSMNLSTDISIETLARIPDVFVVQNQNEVSPAEKALVKKLVEEAALACDGERLREGVSLEKELNALCSRLEELVAEAQELKTQAANELERRFRQRLDEYLVARGFDGALDEQRIAQEVVIHLDRADISEELTRLREHLRAYRQLLKSPEPQGKKLDFYAQELLREVNTIGSKSHIAKLTSLVVEAKTVVEKIRELVQNVE